MNAKIVMGLAVVAGLIAVFMMQRQIDNIRGETVTVYKSTVSTIAGEVLAGQVEEVTIPAGGRKRRRYSAVSSLRFICR